MAFYQDPVVLTCYYHRRKGNNSADPGMGHMVDVWVSSPLSDMCQVAGNYHPDVPPVIFPAMMKGWAEEENI